MASAKQKKKGFTKKILGGSELTMEEYAAYITALKAKPFLTSAGEQSVVEYDRRGKAAKATLSMVNTVREIAGFSTE